MSFIVATNVIASQLPKRRPTGTPTAHANYFPFLKLSFNPLLSGSEFRKFVEILYH